MPHACNMRHLPYSSVPGPVRLQSHPAEKLRHMNMNINMLRW